MGVPVPGCPGQSAQSFRLHYSPNAYYFLTDRSTSAEHRALSASFGGHRVLRLGPGEDALFGDGWSGAEQEEGRYARWAIGRRAFVAFPIERPGVLTLEIAPVLPPQTITVSIQDQPVTRFVLDGGRKKYAVKLPAAIRPGINVIRLDFDHATAPADVDPRSGDHRPLAARVFAIGIDGYDAPDTLHAVRLADANLEESGRPARPRRASRSASKTLAGRLGFEPQTDTDIESMAMSLANESVCMDDQQFLRRMILALLGRDITDRELRQFGEQLQRGVSRRTIIRRLANSSEVAASQRQ